MEKVQCAEVIFEKFNILEILTTENYTNSKLLGSLNKDYIKIYLRKVGFGSLNWIHVARDRDQWRAFVNMAMNLLVP
jgi:hypothetical protein